MLILDIWINGIFSGYIFWIYFLNIFFYNKPNLRHVFSYLCDNLFQYFHVQSLEVCELQVFHLYSVLNPPYWTHQWPWLLWGMLRWLGIYDEMTVPVCTTLYYLKTVLFVACICIWILCIAECVCWIWHWPLQYIQHDTFPSWTCTIGKPHWTVFKWGGICTIYLPSCFLSRPSSVTEHGEMGHVWHRGPPGRGLAGTALYGAPPGG